MSSTRPFSIVSLLLFVSAAFAQQPAVEDKFDYAKYRGIRKYLEGQKYLMEPRLSGDLKTIHEVDQAATKAFNSVAHRATAMKGQAIPAWNVIGGTQIDEKGFYNSGRIRDIAFGPGNVAYVATSNGGLWKTEDITANGDKPTWIPLTDRLSTLSSGSVAVDPSAQNTVYLGTGEKLPEGYDPSRVVNNEGFGDGLFKSVDGGLNWTKIADIGITGTRISEVLIDPTNTQTIYVACDKQRPNTGTDTSGGVIKSTDGGATWRASNLKGFSVQYMVMDMTNPQRLYVSGQSKIFRTTNGGDTWEQITTGLTGSLGRISIDVSPADSNVLYASVGVNNNSTTDGTNGLFISNDFGSTWKKLLQTTDPAVTNYLYQQPWFANAVVAHPTIPRLALAGGLHVVRTNDSGKTLSKVGTAQQTIHADIHNFVYNGANKLYVCHDGGLSLTPNNGNSWINSLSHGISALEFVGVDANKDFTFVLGGTQDNGTNRADMSAQHFSEANPGDGGRTWISQLDSNLCYTTQYERQFYRSTGAGRTGTWLPLFVKKGINQTEANKYRVPFYPRYDADETGEILIMGGNSRVLVSVNGGIDSFAQLSTQTITNARAVRVFPSNANLMWAGASAGLWRSTDMGLNFTRTAIDNGGVITDIEIDPSNPQNLWICSQGYGANIANVFKSTDGGVTVTPIPNFPPLLGANAIVRQHSTGKLFVGTDRGVLFTEDEGQNWYALPDAMPNAIVNSLKLRGKDGDKLLAGTYGRGMFTMDIAGLSGVNDKPTIESPVRIISTHPNPVVGNKVTIAFEMKQEGIMTSTLLDVLGREVRMLEKASFGQGANQFEFTTDGLAAGTYIVLLTANGTTVSERIVVN